MSDDMLRLHIDDESDRFYTLAFLSTQTGQALLTRSKTGNVIDHLSADDLSGVGVPFFESELTGAVVRLMREAILARENARLTLDSLISRVQTELPTMERGSPLKSGWSMRASGLQSRMDAAHWDPVVVRLRADLAARGCRRLGEFADVQLPNWYKRHYVGAEHGRPIISGRQVLQARPVHLQYLAERSLDFEEYEFGAGTIAFGARGRAEDRLSQPTLITQDRASWLGSENVMRVRPKEGVDPGWIFLAMSCSQVQAQVKAGTYGAVVDVVDARRLPDILIPPPNEDLAQQASQCWKDFESARALEDEAIALIQSRIVAETA
ncbi:MAG: hypothetical protein QM626_02660 [Microbacterium sp.]|uniref:hypothetical protein n=1 Tax=Microbacterium sp. TaxID=51671 RepID=UPI0039E66E05